MPRALTAGLVAVALAIALALAVAVGPADAQTAEPFRGLGTWVDAYDYAPAFQNAGDAPSVTPDSVPDMAALGSKTLYLQAAMNDARSPGKIIDDRLVANFLVRAHRDGMQVVAWYFPTLTDPKVDLQHVRAIAEFRTRGQRFDGIALDIEATQGLSDVEQRNDRAVNLTEATRKLLGDAPFGAVVYPAVQTEVLNPSLWPRFPYKRLAKFIDVWMPMTYWTFRAGNYRDPYTYTTESITRLRNDLDDRHAVVHPIGGIGDTSTPNDYAAYMRAVSDTRAIGWSIYDYNTTASSAWPELRSPTAAATTSTTTTTTTTTSTTSTTTNAALAGTNTPTK